MDSFIEIRTNLMLTVDQWFILHYDTILKLSGYYTDDRSIITHFYLWLNKPNRFLKIISMPINEQMKFTNTWMRNNSKWENSEFSKEKKINNFDEIWDEDYEGMPVENNISIEIGAENISDDIKLWLIDIEEEWGDNADKLIRIRKIYLDMNTTDKVLYDLYFTNMMSTRMIAKKLNIPSSSVHIMLTDLKTKIREGCLK